MAISSSNFTVLAEKLGQYGFSQEKLAKMIQRQVVLSNIHSKINDCILNSRTSGSFAFKNAFALSGEGMYEIFANQCFSALWIESLKRLEKDVYCDILNDVR